MRRHAWGWLLFGGAAFLLAACTGSREVRVGVAGPMTGPEVKTGQAILHGVEMAAERANAAGGIRGKRVRVIQADDGDDPERAEAAARELVRQKVAFVVGHVDSGCSLRAAEVYRRGGAVLISAASTNPALTDAKNPAVFRVCGRDDRQGRAAAVWYLQRMPGHAVAVVHDGTRYGKGLAKVFEDNYTFLSGRKPVLVEEVPRGSTDFTALVAKLKENPPQVVYFGGLATQGALLLKAMRAGGVPAGFMAGDGCFGDEFVEKAGREAAEGVMATFEDDLSGRPSYREWVASYRALYGEPGPFSLSGYTAAEAGLRGYENAVYPVSASTLEDALHRLTFDTLHGPLRFDDKGDPQESSYVMWQVVEGKYLDVGD